MSRRPVSTRSTSWGSRGAPAPSRTCSRAASSRRRTAGRPENVTVSSMRGMPTITTVPPRAGHVVRLQDRLGQPDHLERVVGAAPAGQRPSPARPGRRRAGSTRSVAPSCSAVLRFSSTGSMAKMRDAPAMRAPWMTDWPTPPQPMTATVEPGWTFAVLSAAPTPVVTPQPMSASCSSGGRSRPSRAMPRAWSSRRRTCRARSSP